MKRLPPTLREEKRYIKFRIRSESEFEFGDVVDALWDAILGYSGEKGTSAADPWIIKNQWNQERQIGIIKVNREMEDTLRAAIVLIDEIEGENAIVEIEKISGTLKSL